MASLADIIKTLEELAPPSLAYASDNIGIQLGVSDKEEQSKIKVKNCVITLNIDDNAINKAIETKSNLIITHHGLLWAPITKIIGPLYEKIKLLAANRITLFVAHTNWDAAENGISDTLVDILGFKKIDVFKPPYKDDSKPIGRICVPHIENIELKFLLEFLSDKLKADRIIYTGNLEAEVGKICILPGAGGVIDWIALAKKMGVKTYITGEAPYKAFLAAEELKVNLIAATHYATEIHGMRRLKEILSLTHPEIEFHFNDSPPKVNCYIP
ncbi:MAG: Nif3-like dinuclear metal center hexameric protein [Candidatus Odinarchaeia archaeon]